MKLSRARRRHAWMKAPIFREKVFSSLSRLMASSRVSRCRCSAAPMVSPSAQC